MYEITFSFYLQRHFILFLQYSFTSYPVFQLTWATKWQSGIYLSHSSSQQELRVSAIILFGLSSSFYNSGIFHCIQQMPGILSFLLCGTFFYFFLDKNAYKFTKQCYLFFSYQLEVFPVYTLIHEIVIKHCHPLILLPDIQVFSIVTIF